MRLRRAAGQAMMPLMIVSALWFTVYAASTMLVRVPSCPHVVPAITSNCNVAAFVDCQLLGPNHMYPNPTCRQAEPPCPAFDPEGLYTTLGGAILSTLAGVLAGCALPPFPASLPRPPFLGLQLSALADLAGCGHPPPSSPGQPSACPQLALQCFT